MEPVEFVLGGLAACGAGVFSNPLDVVKTRMQLQGELQSRGRYRVHYKNLFHATYVIAKTDGIRGIQSGLAPALSYQFIMNGTRLGSYQIFTDFGWTKKHDSDDISYFKTIAFGAISGALGAGIGSPMYMMRLFRILERTCYFRVLCSIHQIKNQLQVQSKHEIAVGYQHQHTSMREALRVIFRDHGLLGLWRGVDGALLRVMIGSSVQLSTFSNIKSIIVNKEIFRQDSPFVPICASLIGAVVIVTFMTPFDLVSTRLYNQGVDKDGKGLYYRNIFDCIRKVFHQEGALGFYKGWTASCFRLAPHTILCLSFWDRTRLYYHKYIKAENVGQ